MIAATTLRSEHIKKVGEQLQKKGGSLEHHGMKISRTKTKYLGSEHVMNR